MVYGYKSLNDVEWDLKKLLTQKALMQNLRKLSEVWWFMLMRNMEALEEETGASDHFGHNVLMGSLILQDNKDTLDFTTYFHNINLCDVGRLGCVKMYLTFLLRKILFVFKKNQLSIR